MEVPSPRRVNRSRALRSASSESGACREPTWTWLSPRLARTNTSHRGHWCVDIPASFSALLRCRGLLFRRERCGGLSHPLALIVGLTAVANPFGIRLTVPAEHFPELLPIELAHHPSAGFLIEIQLLIRALQPERLELGLEHPYEPLAQFVIAEPFDLPRHRLRRVRGFVIGRAEHHQRREVPPVHRVLCHLLLLRSTPGKGEEDLEALALVEGLFLTDPHHRPTVWPVGGAAQRHLVADRRAIDEPADRPHVGPGGRVVVEDRGVTGLALDELAGHLLPGGSQWLRCGI